MGTAFVGSYVKWFMFYPSVYFASCHFLYPKHKLKICHEYFVFMIIHCLTTGFHKPSLHISDICIICSLHTVKYLGQRYIGICVESDVF